MEELKPLKEALALLGELHSQVERVGPGVVYSDYLSIYKRIDALLGRGGK